MSDQTNGLRFDVYERVHLPDDVAAIDELEEIELVPRIQVIDQGDHAVLKGQLLLSGVYRGQNASEAPLTLEHWIPVEITLPMNRISRLDDISIEIDNFDVDLLSARTLNITGVLSLRGISVEPVQEPEEQWREEPFTVVHQREAYDERPAEEFFRRTENTEQPYIPEEPSFAAEEELQYEQRPASTDEAEAAVKISSSAADIGWSSSQLFNPTVQQAEEKENEEEEAREITYTSQQSSDDSWLATSAPYMDSGQAEPVSSQQYEPEKDRTELEANEQAAPFLPEPILEQGQEPEPEKQELRIAFAGKQPEEGSGPASNVGILTLLSSSRREQAARQAAEEVVAQQIAAEEAKVQASGDEIEWKNLFLGKRNEDTEFRKIRMCIVQKDETLDVIASRYSLNPREILVYNRLDESAVTEGQLIYIPSLTKN
ncbi:LysM peptidoglycan-binding domain-containing protein [Paenibacillus prosopidis]|uniref:Stage VI sporulation protein D n=1 Tax=Paenibacillus prosopidis TaxID=630520 RepID=A0A368VRP0_9BACL|nr:LysM peptidoglycan-binding domain-containing protein [Paenibacillus prosopidis]RCW42626.1 stage VI sporulation protein D [Paenibacillus prosopidis]